MDGMSVAGRRGEIVWHGSFISVGVQRTYDTWLVRFGFLVPFALGDAVHIWDVPQTKFGGPCKAIPLRPDADFRRRVVRGSWIGLGAALGGIAMFLAALGLFVKLMFVPAGAALAGAVLIGGLGFWFTRRPPDEARHRAIRLLLGFHDWGGSDPATWSQELVSEVIDPTAVGAESFAALAETERAAGRWSEAMWAARLCAAGEDEAKGQALTDAILGDPAVVDQMRRVRRRPGDRDTVFGPAPGIRKWLSGDPRDRILSIG